MEPEVVWKLCGCEEHRCAPRNARFAHLSILEGSFVACLVPPQAPERFLVVLRDRKDVLDIRLRQAGRAWQATHQEVDVLRWLVSGDSNKEIAIKLRRSEVSIERRLTSLFRKAKCDGRARLVARFWNVE